MVHEWAGKRTTDEIVELASMFRIPVTSVGTPETVTTIDQFVDRDPVRPGQREHPSGSEELGDHGQDRTQAPYLSTRGRAALRTPQLPVEQASLPARPAGTRAKAHLRVPDPAGREAEAPRDLWSEREPDAAEKPEDVASVRDEFRPEDCERDGQVLDPRQHSERAEDGDGAPRETPRPPGALLRMRRRPSGIVFG